MRAKLLHLDNPDTIKSDAEIATAAQHASDILESSGFKNSKT
jgi:hypothetical protein